MQIAVLIPTYNRPKILRDTVTGLMLHLFPDDPDDFYVFIGDDSDDEYYRINQKMAWGSNVEVLRGPQRGLGANLNFLLKQARSAGFDYVLQLDDDHLLVKDLDLTPHVQALDTDPGMKDGWIRLMFGHSSERAVYPRDYYRFDASLYKDYWRLHPKNTEFWVPTNRPHLKDLSFHNYYGLYDEDVKLGQTEQMFCARWHDRAWNADAPGVFIPFVPPHEDTWQHIGHSWQKEGL